MTENKKYALLIDIAVVADLIAVHIFFIKYNFRFQKNAFGTFLADTYVCAVVQVTNGTN